jgi:hypothetical protein
MGVEKNRVEKVLQKNRLEILNRFVSDFVLSRFWALLGEGSSKTRLKKNIGKKSDPIFFSYSDLPTHHGVTDFFCPAPWGVRKKKKGE